jgi:hypothetical protein
MMKSPDTRNHPTFGCSHDGLPHRALVAVVCGSGGAVIVTTLMIVSLKAAGDGRAAERFAHARGKARYVRPVTLPGLNTPSRSRVNRAEHRANNQIAQELAGRASACATASSMASLWRALPAGE